MDIINILVNIRERRMKVTLLVKDILKRPFFKNSTVLAGERGLDREVKWAHIVEIARFGHLLNGNEVILSTGIGWANDVEKSLSYLQQLLDYNASALCVELVVHVTSLPQKMLELADKHHFPIIVFTEEVKFIDITKDLHEQILGYHEDVWWKLEKLYNMLYKELISNGGVGDFLKILHKETNGQTVLKHEDEYRFFPSPPTRKKQQMINDLQIDKSNYDEQQVTLLGSHIATLYLIKETHQLTQFDKLAVKRCAEILVQFFWKNQQQKEATIMKKNEWMFEAIAGSLTHEEIIVKIHERKPGILTKEAVVAVKPMHKSLLIKDKQNNAETILTMLLKPVLLEYGFQLLSVKDTTQNLYILLLINQQQDHLQSRLELALQSIYEKNNDPFIHNEIQWISFGKIITSYDQLEKSYHTALSTLYYQQNIKRLKKPFYHTLSIYRLIDQIPDREELKEMIDDYIGPLLHYDSEKGTDLLKTLQVYLENLGAKNDTAEQLHIVRQTLYHRLNRIESLIGTDFMHPKKRFMIQFSIYSLQYIDV